MTKKLLLLFIGFFGGLWISWPGIVKEESWLCAKKVIIQSKKGETSLKATMAVSPKFFLSRKSYRGTIGKIRILGDACFR